MSSRANGVPRGNSDIGTQDVGKDPSKSSLDCWIKTESKKEYYPCLIQYFICPDSTVAAYSFSFPCLCTRNIR